MQAVIQDPGLRVRSPPFNGVGPGFFLSCSLPPHHTGPLGGGSRGRGQGPGSSSNSSSTWRGARPENNAASRAPSPAHTHTCPGAPSPTSSSSPSLCRQGRTTAPPSLCQAMSHHHPRPAAAKLTTFRRALFRGSPAQRRRGQDTRMRAGPFARTPKEAPEAKAENETGRSNETKRYRQKRCVPKPVVAAEATAATAEPPSDEPLFCGPACSGAALAIAPRQGVGGARRHRPNGRAPCQPQLPWGRNPWAVILDRGLDRPARPPAEEEAVQLRPTGSKRVRTAARQPPTQLA